LAFLQSDGGSGQGVSQHIQGFSALTEMLGNTGLIARGVLVLLLVASLFSWTVILGKWSSFNRATTQSRRFIRAFRKASRLQEISSLVSECPASHWRRSSKMSTRPISARLAAQACRST
jgi:biopolymer transport protein TolQ